MCNKVNTSCCLNKRLSIVLSSCDDDDDDAGLHTSTIECRKNIFLGMGRMLLISLAWIENRNPSTIPCSDMQWLCMTVILPDGLLCTSPE